MSYEYLLLRALNNWQDPIICSPVQPEDSNNETAISTLQQLCNEDITSFSTISLDFFDTLIRRRISPPTVIKNRWSEAIHELLLAEGISLSPEYLSDLRSRLALKHCHDATHMGLDHEYDLEEVFHEMSESISTEHGVIISAEKLLDIECQIELDNLYLAPGTLEILELINNMGKRCLLASDTYTPEKVIRNYLSHFHIAEYFDSLYISSQNKLTKASGRQFENILKLEHIKPADMLHVGDNKVSDVEVPSQFGIHARWLSSPEETARINKISARQQALTTFGTLKPWFEEISSHTSAPNDGLSQLGIERFSLLFCIFTLELIEKLKNTDIKKVFFLSRDGYLLKNLYDLARKVLKVTNHMRLPDSGYLQLSRKSLALAAHPALDRDALELILRTHKNQGIKGLLKTFAVRPDFFTYYNLDADNFDPDSNSDLFSITRNQQITNAYTQEHQRSRELTQQYLQQQGFLHNTPDKTALVDIGWNGSLYKYLFQAFSDSEQFPEIEGFLFGRNYNDPAIAGIPVSIHPGIIYDQNRLNPLEHTINSYHYLCEIVAAGPGGTVFDYQKNPDDHTVSPVFDPNPSKEYDFVSRSIQKGIISFAHHFFRHQNCWNHPLDAWKAEALFTFNELIHRPTEAELALLNQIPQDLGWGGNQVVFKKHEETRQPAIVSNQINLSQKVQQQGLQHLFNRILAFVTHALTHPGIVVYGAGTVAEIIVPTLKHHVAYIVDNNENLHGTQRFGCPVYPVNHLENGDGLAVIVTVLDRKAEIARALAPFNREVFFMDDL